MASGQKEKKDHWCVKGPQHRLSWSKSVWAQTKPPFAKSYSGMLQLVISIQWAFQKLAYKLPQIASCFWNNMILKYSRITSSVCLSGTGITNLRSMGQIYPAKSLDLALGLTHILLTAPWYPYCSWAIGSRPYFVFFILLYGPERGSLFHNSHLSRNSKWL